MRGSHRHKDLEAAGPGFAGLLPRFKAGGSPPFQEAHRAVGAFKDASPRAETAIAAYATEQDADPGRVRQGLLVPTRVKSSQKPLEEVGGLKTLPLIRSLLPAVPVILSTGRVDQTAIELPDAYPDVSLLPKPFDVDELESHLTKAFARVAGSPPSAIATKL